MYLQPGVAVTANIRLVRSLGAGGMGSVWIADHLALHTQVVVKFMSLQLGGNAEAVERFSREAAAAAQVKSPHVVQMLDHGVTPDGIPFIVMELLEGKDLAGHLAQRGRLTLGETADIVAQVAKALGRAHERGIVHRDIKPDNIFLCDMGGELFVKILDFGIAKSGSGNALSGGTKTGATLGTPYYMSPEQVVGAKNIDARSDLWSLGVVVYQCIVGSRPFDAETFGALALMIHNAPLPLPTAADPSIPPAFDAWFQRACAREPAARFSTARELADALTAVARSQPWTPAATQPVSAQALTPPGFGSPGLGASGPGGSGPYGAPPHVSTHAGLGIGSGAQPPPPSRGGAVWFAAIGLVAVIAIGGGAWFVAKGHRASTGAPGSGSSTAASPTAPTIVPAASTAATGVPPAPPTPAPPASSGEVTLAPAASGSTGPTAAAAPSAAVKRPAAFGPVPPSKKPAVPPSATTKRDERDIF
ncbi:MAG TPA: protein kinase [Polyangiaceae bacterium]|jgi:serine/threonine-protein kinase